MPFYNEVVNTPLFIWDPLYRHQSERCSCLAQTIDLAPTLLDFFGLDIPGGMQGGSLRNAIATGRPVREAALFGIHGGHINCTDGRYVYMRAPAKPDNNPLYNYTLMPTHMSRMFSVNELQDITLAEPFSFTKGCRTMKIDANANRTGSHNFITMLFDLDSDPEQLTPIKNPAVEDIMIKHMIRLMKENDCPAEQYERLGLEDYLKEDSI